MDYLRLEGTLYDDVLSRPSTVVRLDADSGTLVLTNSATGRVASFTLSEGALAAFEQSTFAGSGQTTGVDIVLGSETITLASTDIAAVLSSDETDSLTIYDGMSGQHTDRIEAVALTAGGTDFVAFAQSDGAGVYLYAVDQGGDLTLSGAMFVGDQFADISSMASASIGGESYLLVASATGNAITCLKVTPDGTMVETASLSMGGDLPVMTPQAIEVVETDSGTFVLLASADSASLTVLHLSADGRLTPTDQVIDDLTTRFDDAMVMESFVYDGRAYVLVSGADDGLSLLTVTPSGRIIHLQTIADTNQTALNGITGIEVQQVGGEVQVFVVSGSEGGMTQFSLDLSSLGITVMAGTGTTTGTGANDLIDGSSASGGITLDGRGGDDILLDGAGADTLTGGTGADLFVLSADGVTDTITDFDLGVDSLDLSSWGMIYDPSALTIQETANGAILSFAGQEVILLSSDGRPIDADALTAADIVNISHVSLGDPTIPPEPPDPVPIEGTTGADLLSGTNGNDTILGGGGADTLRGGAGADTLNGGAGIDEADYSTSNGGVTADLSGGTAGTGDASGDVFIDIENLSGSDAGDLLIGNASGNVLSGNGGADTLSGGAGADTLNGGSGMDIADYSNANAGITADLSGNSANTGEAAGDVYISIEGLSGSLHNDVLIGDGAANSLFGWGGEDSLVGGGGADTLNGGAGSDTLTGGSGADHFIIDRGNDTITDYSAGSDTLDLSDLATSVSDITIIPTETGGQLIMNGFTITIITADGSVLAENALDGVTDLSNISLITTNPFDPTEIHGTEGADVLQGDSSDQTLFGYAGNDTMAGGGGNDTFQGGAGIDVVDYSDSRSALRFDMSGGGDSMAAAGGDVFVDIEGFIGGSANDTMIGSSGDNLFVGNGGNDTLTGNNGDDTLDGGDGKDTLNGGNNDDSLTGGEGNDKLIGGGGHDQMFGGNGNDKVKGGGGNDTLNGGEGRDNLKSGGGNDDLFGEAGNDKIDGGGGNDIAWGGSGNDSVKGGKGNDTLYGGGGADTLDGGAGNDTLAGDDGADTFVFSKLKRGESDVISDFEDGVDTIKISGVAGGFGALEITDTTYGFESAALIEVNGHSITVVGVSAADLSADDFNF